MDRPKASDRRAPIDSGKRRPVGMAVISYGEVSGVEYAECSCGQPFTHPRTKVREDAIDRHVLKKHGGMGIRL